MPPTSFAEDMQKLKDAIEQTKRALIDAIPLREHVSPWHFYVSKEGTVTNMDTTANAEFEALKTFYEAATAARNVWNSDMSDDDDHTFTEAMLEAWVEANKVMRDILATPLVEELAQMQRTQRAVPAGAISRIMSGLRDADYSVVTVRTEPGDNDSTLRVAHFDVIR